MLTTNFDTLFERAAAFADTAFAVTSPGARGAIAPRVPLIKLHGSAVDASRLVETSSQKAREVAPELVNVWSPLVIDAELLVLGYSGADLNFGAAQAFFRSAVAAGCRIWWLYRPGAKPSLPDWVKEHLVFIEGVLPNVLRDLATEVGAASVAMHVAALDAQMALRNAMQAWSRERHIGRWAAATFLYSLARTAGKRCPSTQRSVPGNSNELEGGSGGNEAKGHLYAICENGLR